MIHTATPIATIPRVPMPPKSLEFGLPDELGMLFLSDGGGTNLITGAGGGTLVEFEGEGGG